MPARRGSFPRGDPRMSGKKSKKAKHRHEQEKKTAKEKVKKDKKAKVALRAKTKAPPAALKAARPQAAGPPTATAPAAKPSAPARPHPPRQGVRKSSLSQRRGPDGQLLAPGELLLPGGPQRGEEIQYLLRGSVAAEHAAGEAGVNEIVGKKGAPDTESDRAELRRFAEGMAQRFESGTIEPLLPIRCTVRRNFQGVVERARQRRREIGAFLRGLDLGRPETSHMDSHGEASLQS